MKTEKYSYLKDELALTEIRKHKWIESEKLGREIGFATAAFDWITKYGEAWKKYRFETSAPGASTERRRYRRFRCEFPLQLRTGGEILITHTDDFNLLGCTCRVAIPIAFEAPIDVTIRFLPQGPNRKNATFTFKSRISQLAQSNDPHSQKVFIPFNDQVRDYLRVQGEEVFS